MTLIDVSKQINVITNSIIILERFPFSCEVLLMKTSIESNDT
jgi:hypothetical protein